MGEPFRNGGIALDLVDEETAEIKHGVWIPDEPESRDFVRYFYKHSKPIFVKVLYSSTDKKMNVLAYLVDKMNPSDNRVAATHKRISKDMNLPESTVNNAMKFLQEHDYIRIIQNGLWMINPDLSMKGYDSKYLKLYKEYLGYRFKKRKEGGQTTDA